MRRVLAVLVISTTFVLANVVMVSAKNSAPPTAMKLVRKIVKGGSCINPEPVNATGTIAQCTATIYTLQGPIEIHAFKKRSLMLRDLDVAITDHCQFFGRGSSPMFRVGKAWWTFPYRDLESAAIETAIGGALQRFACPLQ
jgi:hypothetical protein